MIKKLALGLLTASILLASGSSADAHRKRSKIHGPFGSWTWGPDIPHIHPLPGGGSNDSCLGGGSPPCGNPDPTARWDYVDADFYLKNTTSKYIRVYKSGRYLFTLSPGDSKKIYNERHKDSYKVRYPIGVSTSSSSVDKLTYFSSSKFYRGKTLYVRGGSSPYISHNKPPSSLSAAPSSTKTYYFKVFNTDSTDRLTYYIGSKKYTLSPGYHRKHTIKGKFVTLEFDRRLRSGKWENYKLRLNADLYDVKAFYSGNTLKIKTVDD